jgi:hypothetical protein
MVRHDVEWVIVDDCVLPKFPSGAVSAHPLGGRKMNEKLDLNLAFDGISMPPASVHDVVVQDVPMTASDVCALLGKYLYEYTCTNDGAFRLLESEALAVEHFSQFVTRVVEMRLYQVTHPAARSRFRSVQYPKCLYPIMEAIGRYDGAEIGAFLKPSFKNDADPKLSDKEEAIIRAAKMAGIPIGIGLPTVTDIGSDLIYKVAINDKGHVVAAVVSDEVDPATRLARLFYDFAALTEVYGSYRKSYGERRVYHPAINQLATIGVKV